MPGDMTQVRHFGGMTQVRHFGEGDMTQVRRSVGLCLTGKRVVSEWACAHFPSTMTVPIPVDYAKGMRQGRIPLAGCVGAAGSERRRAA